MRTPTADGTAADVAHWMKYVRWDVIARWRRTDAGGQGERRYPYAFSSKDEAFARIGGGVLWLISSPRYGDYRMPPALVARLEVTQVVPADSAAARDVDPEVLRYGRWVALAQRDEHAYLPLNNVLHTLHELTFLGHPARLPEVPQRGGDGAPAGGSPYSDLPGRFQRHRVIAPASVPILEDYATAVWKGRRIFLSYRRRDFAQRAWLEELAAVLTANRVSCWWDRWDVPQGRLWTDRLLGDILDDAVHQAAWFVALMRPGYLQPGADPQVPTWVRREWDQAGREHARHRRDEMTRVAVVFGRPPDLSGWIDPDHDVVLAVEPDESPGGVAHRLLGLLPT